MNHNELKQLIKEEIQKVVNEGLFDRFKKRHFRIKPIKQKGRILYFNSPESENGLISFYCMSGACVKQFGGGIFSFMSSWEEKQEFPMAQGNDKEMMEATKKWLEENNVPYDENRGMSFVSFDLKYVDTTQIDTTDLK